MKIAALADAVIQMTAARADLAWALPALKTAKRQAVPAHALPVCDLVSDVSNDGPVVAALIDAIPDLPWQQSYGRVDGFSQAWLDAYGWINLFAPEGLYQTPDLRLSIGYWGAGLSYPRHAHEAVEDYVVLAGQARFVIDDRPDLLAQPGDIVHVPSWRPHGLDQNTKGLLVAAYWRGAGLNTKSKLLAPEVAS